MFTKQISCIVNKLLSVRMCKCKGVRVKIISSLNTVYSNLKNNAVNRLINNIIVVYRNDRFSLIHMKKFVFRSNCYSSLSINKKLVENDENDVLFNNDKGKLRKRKSECSYQESNLIPSDY